MQLVLCSNRPATRTCHGLTGHHKTVYRYEHLLTFPLAENLRTTSDQTIPCSGCKRSRECMAWWQALSSSTGRSLFEQSVDGCSGLKIHGVLLLQPAP